MSRLDQIGNTEELGIITRTPTSKADLDAIQSSDVAFGFKCQIPLDGIIEQIEFREREYQEALRNLSKN